MSGKRAKLDRKHDRETKGEDKLEMKARLVREREEAWAEHYRRKAEKLAARTPEEVEADERRSRDRHQMFASILGMVTSGLDLPRIPNAAPTPYKRPPRRSRGK